MELSHYAAFREMLDIQNQIYDVINNGYINVVSVKNKIFTNDKSYISAGFLVSSGQLIFMESIQKE